MVGGGPVMPGPGGGQRQQLAAILSAWAPCL